MDNQDKLLTITLALAKKKINTSEQFLKFKRQLIAKYKLTPPGNVAILNIYKNLRINNKIPANQYFDKKLKKRPIRSLSGVAVISVLTKPWPCPGKCLYCPSEKGIPKSYLSGEPAVERAKLLKYDPFNQVQKRIETLEIIGHPADKIELIVIGGTWSYLPTKYQFWFIKKCFDAANTLGLSSQQLKKYQKNINTLEKAQEFNELAKHRLVGITLETRPDYITAHEIFKMRKLGATRIELGVQTINEQVLKINQRGHDVQRVIEATKLLKNTGFKVCYHLMPGLMGSKPKQDLRVFQKIFSQADYRPDMIKIYPCVVTRGSKLYKLWQQKKYRPYSDKKLINLLVQIKSIIPPHVRVIRMIRDIPAQKIESGSKISNLRQVVQHEMKKQGLKCRCIRCREIKNIHSKLKNLKLITHQFPASDGQEVFLSFEDTQKDKLVAFLRLRLPETKNSKIPARGWSASGGKNQENIYHYFPILKRSALIREVHTYGELVPIGQRKKACLPIGRAAQHIGLGKRLLLEAERIAQQNGYQKIAVISGVGVRHYYRKLGYQLKNTYLTKRI